MYYIIENRKKESTIFLIFTIILIIFLVTDIIYIIINKKIYILSLLLNITLIIIFLLNWIRYLKYNLEFNNEKILIKSFKTDTIIIKDIDGYACSPSNKRDMFDVIILIKGRQVLIRTHHIKELIDAFVSNNIKRIENINLHAISKQVGLQRLELIIVLIVFYLGLILVSIFSYRSEQRIESKNVDDALRVYYYIDNKRFLIFPGGNKEIIDQEFVKTNDGMYFFEIVQYDNNEFYEEYKRIYDPSNVEYIWPRKYEDEAFNYPTIVTKYKQNTFEYACLNESEKIIAYFYIENISFNEVDFDKKYLPNEFKYYYNEKMFTNEEYDYYENITY